MAVACGLGALWVSVADLAQIRSCCAISVYDHDHLQAHIWVDVLFEKLFKSIDIIFTNV